MNFTAHYTNILKDYSPDLFHRQATHLFNQQYQSVEVVKKYVDTLAKLRKDRPSLRDYLYLPISFFKHHRVLRTDKTPALTFRSSGTTGTRSKHHVAHAQWYEHWSITAFQRLYGPLTDYLIYALLPSYQENKESSLIYMVDRFLAASGAEGGGYISPAEAKELLASKEYIKQAQKEGRKKVLLLGVSYALLDLAEQGPFPTENLIIMETGGMKGRRKEWTRAALHQALKHGFQVNAIHSEYGMTELLSQAYSLGDGLFTCPPWMRVSTRPINEPFGEEQIGKPGLLRFIDLANVDSCAFIETEDLGIVHADGRFEVLGRLDYADVRGCNLLYTEKHDDD